MESSIENANVLNRWFRKTDLTLQGVEQGMEEYEVEERGDKNILRQAEQPDRFVMQLAHTSKGMIYFDKVKKGWENGQREV